MQGKRVLMSSNQLVYVVSSRYQFSFPHVKNSCAAEIPHFKFWITEHLVRLGEQEFFYASIME